MDLPRTRSETDHRGVEMGPALVGCAQPNSGESNLDASQGSVSSLHQSLMTARPLTDARKESENVSAGSPRLGHNLDPTLLTVEADDNADQRGNERDEPGDTWHVHDSCSASQPRKGAGRRPTCSFPRLSSVIVLNWGTQEAVGSLAGPAHGGWRPSRDRHPGECWSRDVNRSDTVTSGYVRSRFTSRLIWMEVI